MATPAFGSVLPALPAPTQRFVKRHEVGGGAGVRLRVGVFGGAQSALGVEQFEQRNLTGIVASARETVAAKRSGDGGVLVLQRGQAEVVARQRALGVGQRGLDDLLVLQRGCFFAGLASVDLSVHAAAVEDAPGDQRRDVDALAAGVEEVAAVEGFEAAVRADPEFREKLGGGHADIGGRRCYQALGRTHVGSTSHDIGPFAYR